MTPKEPMLEGLGLSASEERVYELLVESRGAPLSELASWVALPDAKARQVVASLVERGLVSRSATRPVRYIPAPPQAAIELLVHRREQELHRARSTAVELEKRFRAAAERGAHVELVEVVSGLEATARCNWQMLNSAKTEIAAFMKDPLPNPSAEWRDWKLGIMSRGVRGRVVYSTEALEVPGVIEFISSLSPAGEEPRVINDLPTSLLIVDRCVALLPLQFDDPGTGYTHLLVRRSSLLDALILLFETTWKRASPFHPNLEVQVDTGTQVPPSAEDKRLVALMAAGLQDATIARELGVGPRTIERRLRRIMNFLGTRTRFQTAVEAGRRGWLEF